MNFFKRKKKVEVRTYRLEELAQHWLTPQAVGSGAKNKNEKYQNLAKLEWNHNESAQFWSKYILPYLQAIEDSALLPVIQKMLQILDESTDSSVDPDEPQIREQYKALIGVPLRTHSIQVAQKMIEFMSRHHNNFQPLVGKVVVAALAHDMGMVCKMMPGEPHAINSAIWCEREISSHKNVSDIIDAIRGHHCDKSSVSRKKPILYALIHANEEVRSAELNALQADWIEPEQHDKTETDPAPLVPENDPVNKIESAIAVDKEEKDKADDRSNETADETSFSAKPDEKESPAQDIERPSGTSKLEKSQKWLTEQSLMTALSKQLSQDGFSAFVFGDKAYFQPKVIRSVLEKMALANDDPLFTQVIANWLDPVVSGFGFTNKQARLRFNGKVPPQTGYYFITDKANLLLPENFEEIPPRELPRPDRGGHSAAKDSGKFTPGKFLKKIQIMEGK